jgi:DNA ligase 1
MVEAVARATGVSAALVRRAHMLAGDLPAVASAARTGGTAALREIRLTVLHPVRPMLAKTAEDVATAIERLGTAALEYKVDGARIQVHRSGDTVRVFTRTLNDVTASVPEVVEAARSLSCAAIVLDGEAVVLDAGGRPAPFQVTMSRFGRRQDVAAQRAHRPLTPFFFDILHLDGHDLVTRSGAERHEALAGTVPASLVVARTVTGNEETAGAFLRAALDAGHEGIMAKALDAPYEAGRRGASWLKVKPVHTLDLVVLAVEWGSGRRRGWLSNLHLGAREPRDDGFVMLGKTFKGLSDETLAWQTERFLALETHREGHVVHVRPEQVVEIAFDGIQASPRYPGGMALRFARVKGYRPDKTPDEADTIDTVRAIFEGRR